MKTRLLWGIGFALSAILLTGCHQLPGKPHLGSEETRPDQIKDFAKLYASNCAACHGADGHSGPAVALANPVYEGIVDEGAMRKAIASGGPGRLMPAFGQSDGGMLTGEQVDVLVKGIRQRWYKAKLVDGQDVPPYRADKQGSPTTGQLTFQTYCASCHRSSPQKKGLAGSVIDRAYLSLVSDQSLRTTIIAGRPDLGHPDWRNALKGHAMNDQEVTDIVSWLSGQRDEDAKQLGPASK
jgi:cytochrome c oxidase cbb3-type subunit 3/ubiquinol-cytochrome c reductase cytochrome c subunit